MRFVLLFMILVLGWFLSACSPKFYAVDIDDVDEQSPQQKALIRFSDVQVFARETLLNDRRQEAQHLTELLAQSPQEQFLPQLHRDLSTISALSAQLGIAFDPAVGLKFRSEEKELRMASEIAALSHDIEVTKLRAELIRVQRALTELEEKTGTGPAAPEAGTSPPIPPSAKVQPADFSSIKDALNSAVTSVTEMLTKLTAETAQNARKANLNPSPEDRYEDLSAYRARLRADLATARLDDLHDLEGNALYRLQFRATVFPGEIKNKRGIARLKAEASPLDDHDVRRLYFTWLAHSTRRLNSVSDSHELVADAQYQRLATTGLFDIAHVRLADKKILRLAVMEGLARPIERLSREFQSSPGSLSEKIEKQLEQCARDPEKIAEDLQSQHLEREEKLVILWCFLQRKQEYSDTYRKAIISSWEVTIKNDGQTGTCRVKPPEALHNEMMATISRDSVFAAHEILRLVPSAEAAITALGDQGVLPDEIRKEGEKTLRSFDRVARLAREYLEFIQEGLTPLEKEACKRFFDPGEVITHQARKIPSQFCKALFIDTEDKKTDKKPRQEVFDVDKACPGYPRLPVGNSYAYTALPVQRAQRLSTVASAANSLQLALALSAALPQSGIGINAGLGSLRNTVGKIDALERAPIIVGFSDGGEEKGAKSHPQDVHQAHFGWVFGPSVRANPKKNTLELRQTVASHQVLADLSLPAWWPRIQLHLETAWIQNWYDLPDFDYLDPYRAHPATLVVRLPLSQADLDTLSDRLTQNVFKQGLRRARIQNIKPDTISACSGPITFLIYGVHLWREPQVYLRGRRHTSVEILPDMAGIAATFSDISALPASPGAADNIIVATQVGTTTRPITLDASCRNPQATASVGVIGRRFIKDQELVLQVNPGQLPGVSLGLTIGVRPLEAGETIGWADGEVTGVSADRQQLTGKPKVDPTQPPWNQSNRHGQKYGDSGTLLEAAVLVKLRPGFPPQVLKAPHPIVFYARPEEAQAVLKAPGEVNDLSGEVVIGLPKEFWRAYPDIVSGVARLRGRIQGHELFLGVKGGALPAMQSQEYKFTLEVPALSLVEYNRLHQDKDLTVQFEFDSQEPYVPQVTGTLKIKKAAP
jgi:hypothetical protein